MSHATLPILHDVATEARHILLSPLTTFSPRHDAETPDTARGDVANAAQMLHALTDLTPEQQDVVDAIQRRLTAALAKHDQEARAAQQVAIGREQELSALRDENRGLRNYITDMRELSGRAEAFAMGH